MLILISKPLYLWQQLHQFITALKRTKSYFLYHSGKVPLDKIVVDILYRFMYFALIACQISHFFRNPTDDIRISFTDMFLIIGYFIIIHKLAQIGSEIIVILFSNQFRTEMKRVFWREVSIELRHRFLEFFCFPDSGYDERLQLFHNNIAIFPGRLLSYFCHRRRTKSFIFPEHIHFIQSILQKMQFFANPVEMLVCPFFLNLQLLLFQSETFVQCN